MGRLRPSFFAASASAMLLWQPEILSAAASAASAAEFSSAEYGESAVTGTGAGADAGGSSSSTSSSSSRSSSTRTGNFRKEGSRRSKERKSKGKSKSSKIDGESVADEEDPVVAGPPDAELPHSVKRRLEAVVDDKFQIAEMDHEAMDRRGWLPEIQMGPFRLKETIMLRRSTPYQAHRVAVPDDYVSPIAGRRLASYQLGSLADLSAYMSVDLTNPRVRTRSMAILNAATMPAYIYVPGNNTGSLPSKVYEDANNIYDPPPAGINSAYLESMENSSNIISELRSSESETLAAMGQKIMQANQNSAASVTSEFMGQRYDPCASLEATEEECFEDIGVAISMYQGIQYKATRRVLVFHTKQNSLGRAELLWSHKLWLLEYFQQDVILMWQRAYLDPTPAMLARAGGDSVGSKNVDARNEWIDKEYENHCAFLQEEFKPIPDTATVGATTDINPTTLAEYGHFLLIKKLLREFLPADRSATEPDTYFTGSGLGGMYAAMTSLWLLQEEAKTFQTYVIAGIGWNCFARRLFLSTTKPSNNQDHIHVYSHLLDAYAHAIDRMAGRVCYYGRRHLTSQIKGYCEGIVGYSAAELLWRGGTVTTEVQNARDNWDACHYFTHSPWYAALTFLDEDVLYLNGETDGGCEDIDPVSESTADSVICPTSTRSIDYCATIADSSQALPVEAMTFVASGLFAFIVTSGLCMKIMMENSKDRNWVFRIGFAKNGKYELPACLDWIRNKLFGDRSEGGVDRAAEARKKAKEKREREYKKRQQQAIAQLREEKKKGGPEAMTMGDADPDGGLGVGLTSELEVGLVEPGAEEAPTFAEQKPETEESPDFLEGFPLMSQDKEETPASGGDSWAQAPSNEKEEARSEEKPGKSSKKAEPPLLEALRAKLNLPDPEAERE